MCDSAEKSDEERENTISDKNEATSNVTSATTDHKGDDVGANGQRVDDFFKLSMEGTEATPLAVTSKILLKGFFRRPRPNCKGFGVDGVVNSMEFNFRKS